jgi:hypothetical protein
VTIHPLVPPSITLLLEHPTRQLMHRIRLMAHDATLGQIAIKPTLNAIQFIVLGTRYMDVIFGYFVIRYKVRCVKQGKRTK